MTIHISKDKSTVTSDNEQYKMTAGNGEYSIIMNTNMKTSKEDRR